MKLSNDEKINLVLEDLAQWMDGNDHDGSLEYAFNNGYHLHAASLWLSSGAMSEDIESQVRGITIDRDEEMKEINQLCDEAYIYICPDCNHHAFLEDDYGDEVSCMSCGKSAKKDDA